MGPVDLYLGEGVTCLVGANGAGKSTLFRVLIGIQPRTGGTVEFASKSPSLGYLPQDPELPALATCDDYLNHVSWLQGISRSQRHAAVGEVLACVGLADRSASRIRELSGGMRQRLAFAGALVNRPDLLLLDEPTVGLDPIQRERMRGLIRANAAGRAVFLSTHLLEDVRALANQVAVIAGGRIAFVGAVGELSREPVGSPGFAAEFDAAVAALMVPPGE
ncbi:MAG: ATP-binding cassette domain-containing protein [Bifidobacteriaceae bacterium]|jgi:ABC-2 type transport system ATP-binding protein|nr:ATP-binding cassette domain-containing protein [Bifidobacteriaceae bacterium]